MYRCSNGFVFFSVLENIKYYFSPSCQHSHLVIAVELFVNGFFFSFGFELIKKKKKIGSLSKITRHYFEPPWGQINFLPLFFFFFSMVSSLFAGYRRLEIRIHGVRPVFPVGVHAGLHRGHVRHNIPGSLSIRPTETHRFPAVQHTPAPEQPGPAARNRLLRAHVRRRLDAIVVINPQ